jgi:hypothetical protein
MSYFDDASLVMIPSGYKTSKVYSVKPTDGTGDLAFTRSNDTATRVASNGLIEKVRTNLILQSQDFTTTWGGTSLSVTANTTANPLNGAVNADTITLTGATTQKFITQSFVFSGNYTTSVYLKAGTHQFVQLMLGTDPTPFANFDLVNGTASATGSTATIVSAGSGWYRCSMSFTSVIGTTVFITAADSLATPRFQPTASTGTYIAFGYQLETGDIATDYIATTTAAVSVGPVANVPRLDYLGSSCPRLLLEPQRTNLVTYSEQLNTGSGGTSVVTANTQVSPDGYTNADTIGTGYWTKTTSQAAGTYTLSVFAKYQSAASVLFYIYDGAYYQGSFNLQTGVATTSTGSPSVSMVSYGNGWYRCIVTATTASTISEVGFGSGNFYGYGLQLEAGAYATSYIPTLGASVTRGADFSQKSSISGLFGATATTFVLDFVKKANATGWTITGSNGTKLFSLCQFDNTGGIPRVVFDDGVDTSSTLAALSNGRHKIAVSYTTNDTRIYIDGALVLTDTACTYYQMDRIGVNATAWTGYTNNTNAFEINQFLMIPAATSNADLAALTA